MANKYLALKGEKFDISKVTVVGSPTITSDGVASGFSTSNYLTSSNSITIDPNNFRINFGFTTGSNITTAQMIIRSNDGQNAFIVGLQNEKIRLYLQSATTSGSWDIASGTLSSNLLTTNTKYNGYLSFNGSVYTLNINRSDWITVKSSALIRSSFVLKIGQGMSAEPFLGSVNMLDIKTYSYNQLDYSPTKPTYLLERLKDGYDPNKFTIVGSPTITKDGIVSGFSTSNYINLPIFNLSGGDFEIETLVDYTPTGVGQCFFRCATDTYIGTFGFLIGTYASNKLYISGTTPDVTYDTALTAGRYLIKLVVKDGTANVYLNGNLVITGVYAKSISTAYITVGQGKNAVPFTGSMDLKVQSIKIKGKEVFNGVKEQFYMLRR